MPQLITPQDITLGTLKRTIGLQPAPSRQFFSEWMQEFPTQTLAYMLGNSDKECPTFGMITNGSEFLFLKTHYAPTPQYATSRLFSLINPENKLYEVLAILKHLGRL